jgi:fluoride exporter
MPELFPGLLWVALGCAIGGPARFFASSVIARRFGEAFPWGTLLVNISGSFAIGVAAGVAGTHSSPAWQFAVTGFLGSYTTVSAFSLQTLVLARAGELRRAVGNVLLSLVLCVAAAAAGFALASTL